MKQLTAYQVEKITELMKGQAKNLSQISRNYGVVYHQIRNWLRGQKARTGSAVHFKHIIEQELGIEIDKLMPTSEVNGRLT